MDTVPKNFGRKWGAPQTEKTVILQFEEMFHKDNPLRL